MAFPILPLAIGAIAVVAILVTKKNGASKSGMSPGMSKEEFISFTVDKTEMRCGERMTYIDAQIFDQGMNHLKIGDVKKLISDYESRGEKNLADCLRAKHGL
jgi:hypothetical protein